MSASKENLKNVSFASLAPIGTLGARRTVLIRLGAGHVMMMMFGWLLVPEVRCVLHKVLVIPGLEEDLPVNFARRSSSETA